MSAICTPWIDGDDVAACCSVEVTSGITFDDVAAEASDLLFQLSGRQFSGECEKTVRPCRSDCSCNWQVLSRGFVVWPGYWGYWDWGWGSWACNNEGCGCRPVPRVKLSGYPVTEVSEVKIDGTALDPSDYRLDNSRYVTRLDDARWPACQNLTLPDTESGTWSITYSYGQSPPALGQSAAAQLACELYKACSGSSNCALPTGTIRTTRQGVTIEKLAFATWAFLPASRIRGGRAPGWQSGMALVDAFLNAYNPTGMIRRPVFWSPSGRKYAPQVGS